MEIIYNIFNRKISKNLNLIIYINIMKETIKKSYDSPIPREHPPEMIDGRDFFKLARSKLSYDQVTIQ